MTDILDPQSIGYTETAREIPPNFNMTQMEQDLVSHIFDLYDQFKRSEYRAKKIEAAKQNRKNYDQEVDAKQRNWPWQGASCLNLPFVTIAVDNIEPRIVAALEGKGNEICRFADVGKEDKVTAALQDWFNDEMVYRVQLRRFIRGLVHDICLGGTVYATLTYTTQEEVRTDFKFVMAPVIQQDPATGQPAINPETGIPMIAVDEKTGSPILQPTGEIERDPETGAFLTEDYLDTLFQGGSLDILELSSIYCADDAENWEDADVIREVNLYYGDLCQWQEDGETGWQSIDKFIYSEAIEISTEGDQDESVKSRGETRVHGRKLIPCLEAHIRWDGQSSSDRDAGKFVGSQKIVAVVTKTTRRLIRLCLQRELNFQNRKLIRRLRMFPEFGKSMGTALATKLREVQTGASDTFNLVINSAFICMIPWYFYDPDTTGIGKQIDLIPGRGVPCKNPGDVKFPTFAVNPSQFIEFINIFVSLWERLSSVSDVQVGRAPEITGNRAQTATATMMQVQESNVKHSYSGKTLQEEFSDILDIMYDLYYMYAPMEIVWEQAGDQKIISKLDMRKRRRFVLTGTTETANKYIDRMDAETLYNLAKDEPLADRAKAFEELLREYGKHDPKSYIDPQVNQLLETYLQDPQGVMQAMAEYAQKIMLQRQIQEQEEIAARGGNGGAGLPMVLPEAREGVLEGPIEL